MSAQQRRRVQALHVCWRDEDMRVQKRHLFDRKGFISMAFVAIETRERCERATAAIVSRIGGHAGPHPCDSVRF